MRTGTSPALRRFVWSAGAVYCSHGHGDHSAAACSEADPGESAARFFRAGICRARTTTTAARAAGEHGPQFCFGPALRCPHGRHRLAVPEESAIAALHGCDALLLPIGGYYTVDAEEAFAIAEKIAPRMHRADALPRRGLWL